MRNRHKKSKKIKAVCVSKGQKIPAGYTAKGTVKFHNQEMVIAVPDRILNQSEKVAELVNQVKLHLSLLMGG